MAHELPYFISVRITSSHYMADLPTILLPRLHWFFHSQLSLSTRVPTVLYYSSTGISTCCPSTTSFDLALGPDLPRADQLYSGNLRYSAGRILTFLSLLTWERSISWICVSLFLSLLHTQFPLDLINHCLGRLVHTRMNAHTHL